MVNTLSEESITSTIKSISQKAELHFDFENFEENFDELNQNNFLGSKIKLPKISNAPQIRPIADLAALYLKYHNQQIHKNYQFSASKQQKLFDDLEKARVIILGSKKYRGIKINLQEIIENEAREILEIWDISLLFLQKSLGILSEVFVADFKKNVSEFLQNLEANLENQEVFAKNCAEFIREIQENAEKIERSPNNFQKNADNQPNLTNSDENSSNNEENEEENEKNSSSDNSEVENDVDKEAQNNSKKSEKKQPPKADNSFTYGRLSQSKELEFVEEYKIFTKENDLIVKAADLSEKAELEKLRVNLDLKIQDLEKISHKLRAKLKRKLLSKKVNLNEYNKEEGFVDPKKLTRLIANPIKRDNYLQINDNHYQDTIISLLIDNSGSMRGNPMIMSIMACEIIVQILEKFSIKTEILGFTTSRWHGGKSKKLWEMAGSPANPGRLSDLCHIIYKTSNQSFKKSRLNLALMLKEGVLKENIDGEAIIWASKRLTSYPQNRKILMVISDGAPVDDSTIANNDKNILTNHLRRAISMLEKKSAIELVAIGIGHDVGAFYKNSITIKNLEDLGNSMVDKICDLL